MSLILSFGALLALAVGGYVWWSSRAARAREFSRWQCPRCDKKFRYPSDLAGQPARCPACKKPSVLPADLPGRSVPRAREEGYRLRRKN
jgi:hypothetical protein